MFRKALLVAISIIPVHSVYAGAIDFRLGGNMAELSYLSQVSSFGYGGADIGFGVLINDNDDVMGSGSILVSGSSAGDVKGLHFGVGAKAYAGTLDGPSGNLNADGGAVAIGARVRYIMPTSMPVALLGELFYAPDVTSVSDFNGLNEYRVALEFEVTPSARAYIGYRKLEVKFDNAPNYDVDNSGHIGVRFEF
jgi:hypothetical protein